MRRYTKEDIKLREDYIRDLNLSEWEQKQFDFNEEIRYTSITIDNTMINKSNDYIRLNKDYILNNLCYTISSGLLYLLNNRLDNTMGEGVSICSNDGKMIWDLSDRLHEFPSFIFEDTLPKMISRVLNGDYIFFTHLPEDDSNPIFRISRESILKGLEILFNHEYFRYRIDTLLTFEVLEYEHFIDMTRSNVFNFVSTSLVKCILFGKIYLTPKEKEFFGDDFITFHDSILEDWRKEIERTNKTEGKTFIIGLENEPQIRKYKPSIDIFPEWNSSISKEFWKNFSQSN